MELKAASAWFAFIQYVALWKIIKSKKVSLEAKNYLEFKSPLDDKKRVRRRK